MTAENQCHSLTQVYWPKQVPPTGVSIVGPEIFGNSSKGDPMVKKKKFNLYKVVNENNFPHRHIPFNCERLIPTMKWCIMLHSAVVSWLVYAFFLRDTWVVFSLSLYYR